MSSASVSMDDFFALGGNSLIATRVAARLGQALDAQVPVRVLFEASSVELLVLRGWSRRSVRVLGRPLTARCVRSGCRCRWRSSGCGS